MSDLLPNDFGAAGDEMARLQAALSIGIPIDTTSWMGWRRRVALLGSLASVKTVQVAAVLVIALTIWLQAGAGGDFDVPAHVVTLSVPSAGQGMAVAMGFGDLSGISFP